MLGGCGCLLILFGFAAVVLMLAAESCGGATQQGGGAPQGGAPAGAPGAGAPAQPAARQAAALTIEEESVTAAPKEGGAAVEFSYAARGFATQANGKGHRVRLDADIETYGPDGQMIPSLSKKGFQRVDEVAESEPGGWRFSGTLTLAPGAASGNYVLKIRIADRNSGGTGEHSSRFSLE